MIRQIAIASFFLTCGISLSADGYTEPANPAPVKFVPNSQPLQSHFTVGVEHNYTHVQFIAPSAVTGYQTGVLAGYRFEDAGYFFDFNFEGYWTTGRAVNKFCLQSDLTEYYTYTIRKK